MQHKVELQEAFDNPFTWRWATRGADEWKAVFSTPAGMYDIELAASEFGDSTWTIAFGPANQDGGGAAKFGIHNLGNQTVASRVLATVLAVVKEFAQSHGNIEQYFFSSVEESRTKLYMRMVQRFVGTILPGWQVETTSGKYGTSFMLKKGSATVATSGATAKGMGSETGPTQ